MSGRIVSEVLDYAPEHHRETAAATREAARAAAGQEPLLGGV